MDAARAALDESSRAASAATRIPAAACRSIPSAATKRMLEQLDANKDGRLDRGGGGARPAAGCVCRRSTPIATASLTEAELNASHDRADDQLPNLAIPELNSVGAQEIFVTAAHGVCDFISAMDTDRIREWNAWYHLMNCGLPVKASGETDFPCMSGTRVGQGRSYVQLGKQARRRLRAVVRRHRARPQLCERRLRARVRLRRRRQDARAKSCSSPRRAR